MIRINEICTRKNHTLDFQKFPKFICLKKKREEQNLTAWIPITNIEASSNEEGLLIVGGRPVGTEKPRTRTHETNNNNNNNQLYSIKSPNSKAKKSAQRGSRTPCKCNMKVRRD